jgi:phage-related protein
MAKAAEGNTGALSKLGIGLTAAQLKTMSMEEITAALADTFGGQAAEKADTFAGKMDRLKVAFDEGKETVGSFVLDAITPMISGFVNKVIPTIQALAEELGPKLTPIFQTLTGYIRDYVIPTFQAIWQFITEFVIPAIGSVLSPIIDGLRSAFEKVTSKIAENEEKLKPLLALFKVIATFVRDVYAPVIGKILGTAFDVLGSAISFVIDLFANLVSVVNSAFNAIKNIVNFIKNNPVTQAIGGAIDNIFGGGRANGGPVSRGTSYVVGERGPELFVPNTSGKIIPNGGSSGGGSTINLTVNGAIDPEGTARTIVDVLNRSFSRGTLGALNFQS